MPVFENLNALYKYVETQMMTVMQNDVGNMVKETVMEWLRQTVYANKPSMHQRTYELLNAVTVDTATKVGDTISVRIFIDPTKMTTRPHEIDESGWSTRWGLHMSYDGTDYRESLPFVLEKGSNGLSTFWNSPAYEYMKLSKEEIEQSQKHIKILIAKLASKGINIG